MSDDNKWDCEYCTYKNYPVSKKCVLCQAQRPLQVITDFENAEQDIYKVAEQDARNTESWSSNKETEVKWQCSVCTFFNFTAALKCAQCSSLRKQGVISPTGSCKDFQKPLSVKTSAASSGKAVNPGKTTLLTSPKGSDSSTTKVLTKSAELTVKKWPCKACTYENYLFAKQCTICRTPKGQIFTGNTDTVELLCQKESRLALHVDSKNQENMKSGQNSPNNALNENEQRKSNQNSPNSNRSISGQNSPSNNSSGQNSPKNRSFPTSPNNINTLNENQIIPYGSSCGRNSPCTTTSNQAGQTSPKNNRSGHVSPIENVSGQSSPGSNKDQSSPLIARASKDNHNRNQNKIRNEALILNDGAGAIGGMSGMRDEERRERKIQKLRKKLSSEDLIWIKACEAVVSGDPAGIEQYLTSGGDPTRQLTIDEVLILDRPSAFEVGHTLVHLALRFRRDDMVAVLLDSTDISSKGFKRLPSYTCPDLASDIRREVSVMLRQRKGSFPCYYLTDFATFSLPAEIEDLPRHNQRQLFEEVLDGDVDKELTDDLIINWNIELTEKLGSRLYALWNRTAGDCLLDSVLQATWGILDIDNTLRRALSDSLTEGAMSFYPKWKEYETMQAHLMNFSLDEEQWQRDWTLLHSLAIQPGASLEQMHIFALAHILRRPIVVYGVKVVKSFRGESIDFARFEGVYLPLLWDRSFCWKTPIALGYTRGHFSALVPMEIDTGMPLGAGAHLDNVVDEQIAYLPLVDHEGTFLPIHFWTGSEIGQEETILRRWLDCLVTQDGLFVAIQKIGKRPPPVKQMMEVWLDHYRHSHFTDEDAHIPPQSFSSDGESDQE